jgi:hypothetical protein
VVKLTSAGDTMWTKSIGGSFADVANSVKQTPDGGYVIAGYSGSNDYDVSNHNGCTSNNDPCFDVWVIKLDANGNLLWEKSLGGEEFDSAFEVQLTSDGGSVLACTSASTTGDIIGNHGGKDCWIVKLTSNGEIEWQNSMGGLADDEAKSIKQTSDGGFIVAGFSSSNDGNVSGNHGGSDYWIVKLDTEGSIVWQKSFGGSLNDFGQSIYQNDDGGFVAVGSSTSNDGDVTGNHGGADYWVIQLDADGNLEWQKSMGGSGNDYGTSIEQLPEEKYIVAGYSDSPDGDVSGNHSSLDFWIAKLTFECVPPSSNQASIFPNGSTTFCAKGSVLLNVLVSGYTYQWFKNGEAISGATNITYTADQSGTFTCLSTNLCGSTLSNEIVVTENDKPTVTVSAAPCVNGAVLLTCTSTPNVGVSYQWRKGSANILGATNATYSATSTGSYKCKVNIDATGCNKTTKAISVTIDCKGAIEEENNRVQLDLSPNPFSASSVVSFFVTEESRTTIELFDLAGKKIITLLDQSLSSGNHEIQLNKNQLPAGIYFLQLKLNDEVIVRKVVME